MPDGWSDDARGAPECAVFVGLQASGKTTFYRQRLAATHRHISKDAFPRARNKNARQAALVTAALGEGVSVAVDNTNATVDARAPLIELARAHGARPVAYFFDASVGDCLRRNRARPGKERVPDVAVFVTAKRLTPPSRAEGFDRVWRVTLDEQAGFTVEETAR